MDDDQFFTQYYIQPKKRLAQRTAPLVEDMHEFGPEICAACNYRIECMVQERPHEWACSSARVLWLRSLEDVK